LRKPLLELVALIESGIVEKGASLDICCCSANNAIYLAKQGLTSYGIDISPTAIGYAQEKAAGEGVSCELTSGNALELPYPDSSFTLVFDRGCFHSMPPKNRETFIRGVHRVLKTDGKYQLICFSSKDRRGFQPPYSFSPEDIRRYFSTLFQIRSIRELYYQADGTKRYFLSVLMEKSG
jgi:ubiquinone/menaquinone biosynthesis C-methylase UbiE